MKARGNGSGFTLLEKWLGDYQVLFLRRDRADPLVVPPDKPVQTPITSQVVRETDPIRSTQLGTVDTRRLGLNLVRPRYVAAGADLFGPIR